ncbi:acyltransferase family protein [Microbacterium gallinarum]|uniref:acyltransferase family protein n=1 Tax=Microbacterium gallinarum TaxID=2762209 RepID=UPI00384CEB9F
MQGLRAVAVGLVVLYHAGIPFVPGGYVGVDVFFVISGFLISSHLLESLQRDGRVSFAQFYARRARRILPASFVVAALTAVAVVVVYPPLGAERVLGDALATVLYVPNVRFAIENTDYLADHSPSPYQHYWSLGVEEQFYLLWPVVLLLLFLLARRRGRTLTVLIATLALASLVACVILTPVQQPAAFFLLPTRAWELLAGALVGILLQERRRAHPPGVAAAGGWMGVAMILGAAALFSEATVFPGFAAILPVAGTALVIYFGVQSAPGGPTAALSVRPMQFLGLISYSLYLVHWPLLLIPQAAVGDSRPLPLWATVLLGVVLAIPLAYLLYRWVETPLRAPAALTRRRPRVTLLGTAAVTAVLALGIWAAIGWVSTRPMPTGEAVAAAPDFPSSPPAATDFVPANLTPSLEDAATDIPRLYADDCHHDTGVETVQDCVYGAADAPVRIALFGDSHSAQWFPAIDEYAQEHGEVAISTFTKSSCPAVSATVLDKNSPYTSCDRWRDAVIEHLVADPPELVIFSSYAWYELAGVDDDTERREVWAAGLASTVRALTASGSEVLVIADTPRFSSSPPACVSADPLDVSACAGDRSLVLDEALTRAEAAATAAAGGGFADLTEYICGAAECPVIVDDMLVYRDVNHLTSTYVRYLEPALAEPIDALLR